jgi:hypothetical protein
MRMVFESRRMENEGGNHYGVWSRCSQRLLRGRGGGERPGGGQSRAAGSKCDFNGACVMVPKRNRDEGNRGAGEGVERRRRPSGVRSHAEEVAGGAQRRTAWWHRPKEAAARVGQLGLY